MNYSLFTIYLKAFFPPKCIYFMLFLESRYFIGRYLLKPDFHNGQVPKAEWQYDGFCFLGDLILINFCMILGAFPVIQGTEFTTR